MIRTKLLINGQKTSVGLLKNSKVTLQIQDYLGSPEVSRTYSDLKFSDNEETIISFQVPPNLMHITLSMTCDVQNVTENKLQSFSSDRKLMQV